MSKVTESDESDGVFFRLLGVIEISDPRLYGLTDEYMRLLN